MEHKPLITVIITVHNGENFIRKCLDSILSLNYSNYEIIVVNDGSTDNTGKILLDYKDRIKIIETKVVGPSKARNLAVEQSRGEYVAFTDADCIVSKNWLDELLSGFKEKQLKSVVGVGGDQLSPEDETEFGKIINDFMHSIGMVDYVKNNKQEINFTQHNPSCNVMYKKEIFVQMKGFREGLWPGEDVELDYRIIKSGYKLVFNPNAVVYHYRVDNMIKFIKMMFRYGVAQGILVRIHSFFRKIHFVPIIFFPLVTIFCWSIIISFKFSFGLFLLILNVVILYAMFRTKNIVEWLRFLVLFFVTMICWNIGFLFGVIRFKGFSK